MNWNSSELHHAAGCAAALSAYETSRRVRCNESELILSAAEGADLVEGLHQLSLDRTDGRDPFAALPVRHLFRKLGFDEGRPFQWQLEHRLVHLLVLNHFLPGSVVPACGLSRYA